MAKIKILFVCTGNICRSPLAEAILRDYVICNNLIQNFEIDSCGTSDYHIGQLPDERAIAAAYKNRITLTHRARQLTESDLYYYDYILVMDHLNYDNVLARTKRQDINNKVFLLRSFDTTSTIDYNVPDPYYGTTTDFEEVLVICKNSIMGFITFLSTSINSFNKCTY